MKRLDTFSVGDTVYLRGGRSLFCRSIYKYPIYKILKVTKVSPKGKRITLEDGENIDTRTASLFTPESEEEKIQIQRKQKVNHAIGIFSHYIEKLEKEKRELCKADDDLILMLGNGIKELFLEYEKRKKEVNEG